MTWPLLDFSKSSLFPSITSKSSYRSSFLELNTAKTKELVLGGDKGREIVRPVSIENQEVEIVNSYKYLGTLIDQNLIFCDHVDLVYKKAQQRLLLWRNFKKKL